MSPPPEIAELITLFTQAALYGLYVAAMIHCLRWLLFADEGWKQRKRIDKFMLIAAILIFLLSTANLVLLLPYQFYVLGADTQWSVAEEIATVCEYHGQRLERKIDLPPRI